MRWSLVSLQAVPGLTQEQDAAIYGLFDAHVDAGLAWVRKQGSEYIPSVDNNLTTSLTMIMQVCLRSGCSQLAAAVLASTTSALFVHRTKAATCQAQHVH